MDGEQATGSPAGLAPVHALLAGALLLLPAACGDERAEVRAPVAEADPSSQPARPAVVAPAVIPPVAAERRDLCAALGRIVDAEPEGFLVLRGQPEGDGRWGGTAVPAGFADCWVEDLAAAGPHYLCRAERFADAPDPLAADHLTLLSDLDSCFARSTWFPLSWQRASGSDEADGSRRTTWRAGTMGPAVALALAPHPDRPLWWNLLVVGPAS